MQEAAYRYRANGDRDCSALETVAFDGCDCRRILDRIDFRQAKTSCAGAMPSIRSLARYRYQQPNGRIRVALDNYIGSFPSMIAN